MGYDIDVITLDIDHQQKKVVGHVDSMNSMYFSYNYSGIGNVIKAEHPGHPQETYENASWHVNYDLCGNTVEDAIQKLDQVLNTWEMEFNLVPNLFVPNTVEANWGWGVTEDGKSRREDFLLIFLYHLGKIRENLKNCFSDSEIMIVKCDMHSFGAELMELALGTDTNWNEYKYRIKHDDRESDSD